MKCLTFSSSNNTSISSTSSSNSLRALMLRYSELSFTFTSLSSHVFVVEVRKNRKKAVPATRFGELTHKFREPSARVRFVVVKVNLHHKLVVKSILNCVTMAYIV